MQSKVDFNAPIESLNGIGPKKKILFHKVGVYCVSDLYYSFPNSYEDRTNEKKIEDVKDGENVIVRGILFSKSSHRNQNVKKRTLKVYMKDDTGMMEATFFNSDYLDKTLRIGDSLSFFGRASVKNGHVLMIHPECTKTDSNKDEEMGILPVYSLTNALTQRERRKAIKSVWEGIDQIEEYLPLDVLESNKLCGIEYALKNIHYPGDGRKLRVARYRLIFEEFFILQLGLLLVKNSLSHSCVGIEYGKEPSIEPLKECLPFPLTGAQNRAIEEILNDMCTPKVMNRLVQGDVGSGKTVVAAAAIYKAVCCGYQVVLMAPTEILAKQHLETMKELFHGLNVRIGFLSGSMGAKEKRETLALLENGNIDLVIGTHALIQPNVVFHHLGLVITDEQHRFGVNQRITLSDKGENPDILVMTATPIPRTLALILYGDLDISIIDEMPPGRKEIQTRICNETLREKGYQFVYEEIKKGRQAYVVAPLIEDSELLEGLRSVESLYEELTSVFEPFQVGLLHGNMKQKQKDEIMARFQQGEIGVLIATVVIEVGINVPNATVMVIENAERFGLAQMHQLRGRVGRGQHQSYCLLMNSSGGKIAKERGKIMAESSDGFVIAEKDLTIRGPGEFFGVRQHGIPELKIANLLRHMEVLKIAQREAKKLLEKDPLLSLAENHNLQLQIELIFQKNKSIGL